MRVWREAAWSHSSNALVVRRCMRIGFVSDLWGKNSVRCSLWGSLPDAGWGQGARKSVSHLIVEGVAKTLFGISEVLNEGLYDKAKTL